MSIQENRKKYLSELRSGKWKKGTVRSDEKGRPIIESDEERNGSCACGIMVELFPKPNGEHNFTHAKKQLGITSTLCQFIQVELNDTTLNFNEIADRIENEIFNKNVKA